LSTISKRAETKRRHYRERLLVHLDALGIPEPDGQPWDPFLGPEPHRRATAGNVRFYVAALLGIPIDEMSSQARWHQQTLHLDVLDRAYCCRQVWTSPTVRRDPRPRIHRLLEALGYAAGLNARHGPYPAETAPPRPNPRVKCAA
jgi:hypothetical protein